MASIHTSPNGVRFRVNDDGSITRLDNGGGTGGSGNTPAGGSGGNSGDSSSGGNRGGGSGSGGNSGGNSGGGSGGRRRRSKGWVFLLIAALFALIFAVSKCGGFSTTDIEDSDDAGCYNPEYMEETVEEDETVEALPATKQPATAPATKQTTPQSTQQQSRQDSRKAATYLNLSNTSIDVGATSYTRFVNVYTDGAWEAVTDAPGWIKLTKLPDQVKFDISPNSGESRIGHIDITAGNMTRRVSISQMGANTANAQIVSVWTDYDVTQNGEKGMMVHARFNVNNMKGKVVYVYVNMYYGDNATPLKDRNGNPIQFCDWGTSDYNASIFSDFSIFVPHSALNMKDGSYRLSYDLSVRDADGRVLARDRNHQFNYSQGY